MSQWTLLCLILGISSDNEYRLLHWAFMLADLDARLGELTQLP